jgi:uncharacterized protein with PIN domain
VKPVLTEYSQGMRLSKHSFKRKQKQDYDTNYHLKRKYHSERDTRILISRCDLCNEQLPKEADNIQYHINLLDEIADSFESEYDKHEPKLLLCSHCTNEYNIPNYLQ